MRSFAEFVKDRMSVLGKSQKALARELGVSAAYVSQIINGRKNPPDLGKLKNRGLLKIWRRFLDVGEEDLIELVRFELHSVPPRPRPRYGHARRFLIERLARECESLADEIQSMEYHPAENCVLRALVQIYFASQDNPGHQSAYAPTRFKELCSHAQSNREFLENDLPAFFHESDFSWCWNPELNSVTFCSDLDNFKDAVDEVGRILAESPEFVYRKLVPVVGHVSAGGVFEYTDGGFSVGDGFEIVDLPPAVGASLASRLYCVRVRGNSLANFLSDGALVFIQPESWEEIKDGDLVIVKSKGDNKSFMKKIEFKGENLILKSINPPCGAMRIHKSDMMLLERVMAIVL